MTETERVNAQGRALLRVAREMREWLSSAPTCDPDLRSLMADIEAAEDIGRWLSGTTPIELTHGVLTR